MKIAKAEEKIRFLKEYRAHPEKYFPLIDHAWKCFAEKDTGENPWDDPEYNIGWNAGEIGGNRPFFLECWATCGITMLTYFVSASGMENAETSDLIRKLEDAKLLKIRDPKRPRTTVMDFEDGKGNQFYSINITVGDEDGTYIDGGKVYPYAELNRFNKGKNTKSGGKE